MRNRSDSNHCNFSFDLNPLLHRFRGDFRCDFVNTLSPCRDRSPAKEFGKKWRKKWQKRQKKWPKSDRKSPENEKKWSNSFCRPPFATMSLTLCDFKLLRFEIAAIPICNVGISKVQQFPRVTSIGSLPRKISRTPAEPRRTLGETQSPRRALWDAEPSERQISSESLAEGCAPRMVTLRNFRSEFHS